MPPEASRAIYIDFEGCVGEPPGLLGILWRAEDGDHFEQIVLAPALAPAANGSPKVVVSWAGYQRATTRSPLPVTRAVGTLDETIGALTRLAEAEDRLLVSWSRREPDAVQQELTDEALKARFLSRWRDGKATARRWKHRHHRDVKLPYVTGSGLHRLSAYMELIGYTVPPHLGHRKAAARLRYVREQLAKKDGDYARLTPVAKTKWTKLLDYNWHDCNGLREVVVRAAAELSPCVGKARSSPGDD